MGVLLFMYHTIIFCDGECINRIVNIFTTIMLSFKSGPRDYYKPFLQSGYTKIKCTTSNIIHNTVLYLLSLNEK